MAQIFPKWMNRFPAFFASGSVILGVGIVLFVWYYFSPWYTDVGFQPVQPVPFSHKLHADDLGLDCRYCHSSIERSPTANVPPTQTCMNCHKIILPESEKLLPIRESWAKNEPMKWVRVHKLPDFVYFDHSVHLDAGVGCATCHGQINQMERVTQKKPLSMSWCLDCHRNPDDYLRPRDQLTNMNWVKPADQAAFAEQVKKDKGIVVKEDCSVCHR